jgi:hypothetical protein
MHYGIALDVHIESAIDSWRTDRDRAWTKDPDAAKVLELTGNVADIVLRTSKELVVPGGFEARKAWDWIRSVIETTSLSEQVVEDLQISLARELIPDTEAMAHRCIDITREVLFREPNESVRRFVARLTRCFVAGYLPECVMLCRAVLENAVTELSTALKLKAIPNKDGFIGMSSRLDALLQAGRLDDKSRQQAQIVWKRGNTAVHKDPLAVSEVTETVDMTMRILGDLYRQPLPPGSPSVLADA